MLRLLVMCALMGAGYAQTCPPGWTFDSPSSSCFGTLAYSATQLKSTRSRANADMVCNSWVAGAKVANVKTAAQWNIITKQFAGAGLTNTDFVWLGATDSRSEGNWRWSDGTSLTDGFSNWMPDRGPGATKTNRNDVVGGPQGWKDVGLNYYVTDTRPQGLSCQLHFISCPPGWTFDSPSSSCFGTLAYRASHEERTRSHENADMFCLGWWAGAKVANVKTAAQWNIISDQFAGAGLTDANFIWLGATRSHGIWRWSDGTNLTDGFTNWMIGRGPSAPTHSRNDLVGTLRGWMDVTPNYAQGVSCQIQLSFMPPPTFPRKYFPPDGYCVFPGYRSQGTNSSAATTIDGCVAACNADPTCIAADIYTATGNAAIMCRLLIDPTERYKAYCDPVIADIANIQIRKMGTSCHKNPACVSRWPLWA